MGRAQVLTLTALAILAFAGNSLLTRFGLVETHIEPAQFAGIRLISGAMMLTALSWQRTAGVVPTRADLVGILSLFGYAVTFTIAGLSLNAATGTLILFGSVQITLATVSAFRGSPPKGRALFGLIIAFAGLIWMLLPQAVSPPLGAALLMSSAGIAWGVYTIAGRVSGDPIARTARNFIGAAALAAIWLVSSSSSVPPTQGVILAIASGTITSALGYTIWYSALPHLSVATAGAAQLFVPVVAAVGAAMWLHEQISAQLVIAGVIILGGIAMTLDKRRAAP